MDKVKYITVSEYSRLMGVHPNTVGTQLRMGKIKGMRVGKAWRVEVGADVDIPSVGEKATILPTDQPAIQPTEQPTELDELDKETAAMQKEAKLLEGKQKNIEMRLEQEAHISWDEFQKQRAELSDKEKLVAGRERVAVQALQEIENTQGAVRKAMSDMEEWWSKAGGIANSIVELLVAITSDKYDPAQAEQYEVDLRTGKAPKVMLTGKQVKELSGSITELLWRIARLPEPGFSIPEGGYTEDSFDETDEQEPDEVDAEQIIEAVGKDVDKEVSKEIVQDTNVDVPAIIKPRKKVKDEK